MPLILVLDNIQLSMLAGIFNYVSLSDIQEIQLYGDSKMSLAPYSWSIFFNDYFGNPKIFAVLKLMLHPDVNI